MKNEPIVHNTSHPVTASAGPDNAYYLHHCAEIERGPAYTACLSRLKDIDAGRSNERTAQCEKAVREKRCVAHGMREQEQLAGSALFYFPRSNKPFLPASVAGDFGVLITNLTDPALIPKKTAKALPKPVDVVDKELAVDVLSKAIGNAAQSPTGLTTVADVKKAIEAMPAASLPPLPPMAPSQTAAQIVAETTSTAPKIQPGETPLQFARRMAELRKSKQ